jgi:2-dehydro-3-deoxyphosphogluconate aldolase/(4S)-4-hydroxy-2-oxoglutarate aldolase
MRRRYAVWVTNATTRPAIPAGLAEGGVVAIARRLSAETAPRVADALAAGGVRAFEITLNEPQANALRAIEAVAAVVATSSGASHGLAIGGGTVLTIEAARSAVDAGATFLVMPHTDPELVTWAVDHGIPTFPGAATPTEVLTAWRAGAAAIKVFPASAVGPAFIRELHGPFPDIPLVPTGGVTADNAGAFIAAGAIAVGLGSWLVGDGDPAGVTARARQVVDAVRTARGKRTDAVTPAGQTGRAG